MKKTSKIFAGIYSESQSKQTDQLIMNNQQASMDQLLVPFYVWETLAHNYMLVKKNLVPAAAGKKILTALLDMMEKASAGTWKLNPLHGDVHENMELELHSQLGPPAGWFHLARSRNDQITCDQKLMTKNLFFKFGQKLYELGLVLSIKSSSYQATVMPGFTHLRTAMPSSFGFWWQSYLAQVVEMQSQLQHLYDVTDQNPLGAGASYGVNWPIDPHLTSQHLGFGQPVKNALTAINNRGLHELKWVHQLVVLATILSRMAEDLLIWSQPELGLITLSEQSTSGSSIMPQKINPDVVEKMRSKAGMMLGYYVQLATSLKGTPSGYNRDSAESKVIIIQAFTEITELLVAVVPMLERVKPVEEKMLAMTTETLATKLADQLSLKYQLPFRVAHQSVGLALKNAQYQLKKITSHILQQAVQETSGQTVVVTAKWLAKVTDVEQALSLYSYQGSPQVASVAKITKLLTEQNHQFGQWLSVSQAKWQAARTNLITTVQDYVGKKDD